MKLDTRSTLTSYGLNDFLYSATSTDGITQNGDGKVKLSDFFRLRLQQFTDPSANAAVATSVIDSNLGVLVTLTTAGNPQTLSTPTVTTRGKTFLFINSSTSTDPITVSPEELDDIVLSPGESLLFTWDGFGWTYSTSLIKSVFGRKGVITAQSGDYNTSQVTESSNLYFTNPRVLATTLTGFSAVNSSIISSDSILQAFGKTQGQINNSMKLVSTPTNGDLLTTNSLGQAQDSGVSITTSSSASNNTTIMTSLATQTAITSQIPLTTKGDLFTRSTINARLPVGSDGRFLIAQSSQTTGLQWTSNAFLDGNNGLQIKSTTGWLAGVFGAASTYDVVVMGTLNNVASLGAHNTSLSAWAPLYIQPVITANLGICLNPALSQVANANLHSAGSTILGFAASAVPDASIYPNQVNLWYDESNSRLVFKAKSSASVVTSFPLGASSSPLTTKGDLYTYSTTNARLPVGSTGQMLMADSSQTTGLLWTNATSRISTTVDSNGPKDRLISLDSTTGANLFIIDRSFLLYPITISWTKGANVPSFQALGGQSINGLTTAFSFAGLYGSATIAKDENDPNGMVIISFR